MFIGVSPWFLASNPGLEFYEPDEVDELPNPPREVPPTVLLPPLLLGPDGLAELDELDGWNELGELPIDRATSIAGRDTTTGLLNGCGVQRPPWKYPLLGR